jgi:hypothetical protein
MVAGGDGGGRVTRVDQAWFNNSHHTANFTGYSIRCRNRESEAVSVGSCYGPTYGT